MLVLLHVTSLKGVSVLRRGALSLEDLRDLSVVTRLLQGLDHVRPRTQVGLTSKPVSPSRRATLRATPSSESQECSRFLHQ